MHRRMWVGVLLVALVTAAGIGPAAAAPQGAPRPTTTTTWNLIEDAAPWAPRAGLQVVDLKGRFYLMGGRTPNPPSQPPIPGDSTIWGDVWSSDDQGSSWTKLLDTATPGHWPARAYFSAVTKGRAMFVLGGQDFDVVPNPACPPFPSGCPPFISSSEFFDDVWRSTDGVTWKQMTEQAGWEGRAGLSAEVLNGEIYVFAGSKNDDSSIVGGPPQRVYFNDVWKSRDGATWQRLTEHAPWSPRAGAATVVKGGYIYLLGGEVGFTCQPLPGCTPPYFNDVWRTRDGVHWQQVTAAAGWSARPGHKCAVSGGTIVCFGGFGLLQNPLDTWGSDDGARWVQLDDAPWNAVSPDQAKYDFAVVAARQPGCDRASIFTFGGDRETFDFNDPTNYLRVDNDVWRLDLSHARGAT